MSGAGLPYHLRPAKAIDRALFVDLLARVGRAFNISDYTYIGLGGPFLEDFKSIHTSLRIRRMKSVELSSNTYKRQEFNRPYSSIELLNKTTGDFIESYDFDEPVIIWLDYTSPSDLGSQLAELRRLVSKLKNGDVFKITLNANPAALGNPPQGVSVHEFRFERACERLGDYRPSSFSTGDLAFARFPEALLEAVELAAKKGLEAARGNVVEFLSAFRYADGQQMVTVTGIVLSKAQVPPFFALSRLQSWPYYWNGGGKVDSISVPVLSAKERNYIESRLPEVEDPLQIAADLGFIVGDDPQELANFIKYYRQYPTYSRMVV